MPKVSLDPAKKKSKAIHRFVRAEMKEQKISYEEMGADLGITHQGFSYKINNQKLSVEDLIRCLDRLGTDTETVADLLRGI